MKMMTRTWRFVAVLLLAAAVGCQTPRGALAPGETPASQDSAEKAEHDGQYAGIAG